MSIQISEQERRELKNGKPVRVLDSESNQEYVLLQPELFERVAPLLFDPGDPTDEEMTQLAWEAGVSIGWDSPEMAEYDNYDEHRKPK